jgi:hypothetical protein
MYSLVYLLRLAAKSVRVPSKEGDMQPAVHSRLASCIPMSAAANVSVTSDSLSNETHTMRLRGSHAKSSLSSKFDRVFDL